MAVNTLPRTVFSRNLNGRFPVLQTFTMQPRKSAQRIDDRRASEVRALEVRVAESCLFTLLLIGF